MTEINSFRTRKNSIYNRTTKEPFKISRSKFFNFLNCKRCFYLDRVIGLKELSSPPYTLNNTVDELLKKEFDFPVQSVDTRLHIGCWLEFRPAS